MATGNHERPDELRGRPRDARAHRAILDATSELLVEAGYRHLTIEEVARRAGVSKATIYRWWESKGLLVYEAVFAETQSTPLPDTGDLASDLRALLENLIAEFTSPAGLAATPGLLADFGSDARLRELIRGRFIDPARVYLTSVLERAIARGDTVADAPIDLVLDQLAGTVFWRIVVVGASITDEDIDRMVRLILKGVAAR